MPTFPLGVNYAILSQKYVFLPPRATSLTSQSENLMNLDGWRCQVQEGWKWKSLSRVQLSVTPWTIQSSNSLGQNTGVGSLSLLQGIFPTQGLNPGILHCRQILYQLSHKGSPRILEWVAYPFFRGSSQPRNQTRVSCIAGRFFTNWAMRLEPKKIGYLTILQLLVYACQEHACTTHSIWLWLREEAQSYLGYLVSTSQCRQWPERDLPVR